MSETAYKAHPLRIQLSRRRGYKKPPCAIVVARPSKWGNPFKVATKKQVKHAGKFSYTLPVTVEQVLIQYRRWLEKSPQGQAIVEAARKELRGKALGCWCKINEPCHADILLDLIYSEAD